MNVLVIIIVLISALTSLFTYLTEKKVLNLRKETTDKNAKLNQDFNIAKNDILILSKRLSDSKKKIDKLEKIVNDIPKAQKNLIEKSDEDVADDNFVVPIKKGMKLSFEGGPSIPINITPYESGN